MWIKHLTLLPILLICCPSATVSEKCVADKWIFLCENPRIFVDDSEDMKPIRMPLTSADCDNIGAEATCESILEGKLGQKILVKAGIHFSVGADISPCDTDRHIRFSSSSETISKVDKKCGHIETWTELFTSVEETLTVMYRSNSIDDGAVISAEAYGCSYEGFSAPNPNTKLELTTTNFKPTDSRYEGLLRCDEGYLMPGNVSTKAIFCESSPIPPQIRRNWQWERTDDETACNRVTCAELPLPTNGRHELSNGFFHQSVATFYCGVGYTLEGDNTQTCLVEEGTGGYWQGTTPTCKIIDCGTPMMNNNYSYILPAITTYQSTFSYSCAEGLLPITAQAICTADGSWQYIMCKVIERKPVAEVVCTAPPAQSNWLMISPEKETWSLGESITYSCKYESTIAAITCQTNGSLGSWTSLDVCKKTVTLPPIERMTKSPGATNQQQKSDRGAVVGGIIAGFIVAIIIVVLACIFIKKSRGVRKDHLNNNEEELKSLRDSQMSTTMHDRSNSYKPDSYADIESQITADPEVAAVVKHYHNRGNNRLTNGVNGTTTMNSHKSSGSALSVEPLETGDILDSVMNGGTSYDRKSGSNGRPASSTGRKSNSSNERKSTDSADRSSHRRSADSTDRKSSASTGRKSTGSIDGTSRGSIDRRSGSSIDRKHAPTCRKYQHENGMSHSPLDNGHGDPPTNGVTPYGRIHSVKPHPSSDFF